MSIVINDTTVTHLSIFLFRAASTKRVKLTEIYPRGNTLNIKKKSVDMLATAHQKPSEIKWFLIFSWRVKSDALTGRVKSFMKL